MLDRAKIQAQLDALQRRGNKQSTTFEKTDFTKIYWKPRLGSQYIRIVPSKLNKSWPFQEVSYHRDITVKTMYALTNWGEKDPIVEFIDEFKTEIYKKKDAGQDVNAEYDTLSKLRPKTRTYLQVIVRGEEYLGTRLWEFGNEVKEQILKIMNNTEYGDITEIVDGTDLEVVGINAEYNGNKYIKPSITPRRNSSPLASDDEQLQKFLNEQHDPLKLFKKYTYDEIYDNLEKWLNPPMPTVDENMMDLQVKTEDNIDDLPFVPDPPTSTVEVKETKKPIGKDKSTTTATPKEAVTQATKKGNKFSTIFNEQK